MEEGQFSSWLLWRLYIGDTLRLRIGTTTIGRHSSCTIRVTKDYVSRIHAEIIVNKDDKQVQIKDMQSSNGVFVNGKPYKNTIVPLKNRDKIGIGVVERPSEDNPNEVCPVYILWFQPLNTLPLNLLVPTVPPPNEILSALPTLNDILSNIITTNEAAPSNDVATSDNVAKSNDAATSNDVSTNNTSATSNVVSQSEDTKRNTNSTTNHTAISNVLTSNTVTSYATTNNVTRINVTPTNVITTDVIPTNTTTNITETNVTPSNVTASIVTPSNVTPSDQVTTRIVTPSDVTINNMTSNNVTTSNVAVTHPVPGNIATTNLIPGNVPTNIDTTYAVARNLASIDVVANNVSPKNVAKIYVATSNLAPKNVATSYVATSNVTPIYVAASNLTSSNVTSSDVTSSNVASSNLASINFAPNNLTLSNVATSNTPSNTIPSSLTPRNVSTSFVTTNYVATSNVASSHDTTNNLMISNVTTGYTATSNLTTSNIAAIYVAPSNISPRDMTPRDVTSSNVTQSNLIPTNVTLNNVTPSNVIPSNISPREAATNNVSPMKIATCSNLTPSTTYATTNNLIPNNLATSNPIPSNVTTDYVASNSTSPKKASTNVATINITPSYDTKQNATTLAPIETSKPNSSVTTIKDEIIIIDEDTVNMPSPPNFNTNKDDQPSCSSKFNINNSVRGETMTPLTVDVKSSRSLISLCDQLSPESESVFSLHTLRASIKREREAKDDIIEISDSDSEDVIIPSSQKGLYRTKIEEESQLSESNQSPPLPATVPNLHLNLNTDFNSNGNENENTNVNSNKNFNSNSIANLNASKTLNAEANTSNANTTAYSKSNSKANSNTDSNLSIIHNVTQNMARLFGEDVTTERSSNPEATETTVSLNEQPMNLATQNVKDILENWKKTQREKENQKLSRSGRKSVIEEPEETEDNVEIIGFLTDKNEKAPTTAQSGSPNIFEDSLEEETEVRKVEETRQNDQQATSSAEFPIKMERVYEFTQPEQQEHQQEPQQQQQQQQYEEELDVKDVFKKPGQISVKPLEELNRNAKSWLHDNITIDMTPDLSDEEDFIFSQTVIKEMREDAGGEESNDADACFVTDLVDVIDVDLNDFDSAKNNNNAASAEDANKSVWFDDEDIDEELEEKVLGWTSRLSQSFVNKSQITIKAPPVDDDDDGVSYNPPINYEINDDAMDDLNDELNDDANDDNSGLYENICDEQDDLPMPVEQINIAEERSSSSANKSKMLKRRHSVACSPFTSPKKALISKPKDLESIEQNKAVSSTTSKRGNEDKPANCPKELDYSDVSSGDNEIFERLETFKKKRNSGSPLIRRHSTNSKRLLYSDSDDDLPNKVVKVSYDNDVSSNRSKQENDKDVSFEPKFGKARVKLPRLPEIIEPPQLPKHRGKLRGVAAEKVTVLEEKRSAIINDLRNERNVKDLKRKWLEKSKDSHKRLKEEAKKTKEARRNKLKELCEKKGESGSSKQQTKTSRSEASKEDIASSKNESSSKDHKSSIGSKATIQGARNCSSSNRGSFLTKELPKVSYRIPKCKDSEGQKENSKSSTSTEAKTTSSSYPKSSGYSDKDRKENNKGSSHSSSNKSSKDKVSSSSREQSDNYKSSSSKDYSSSHKSSSAKSSKASSSSSSSKEYNDSNKSYRSSSHSKDYNDSNKSTTHSSRTFVQSKSLEEKTVTDFGKELLKLNNQKAAEGGFAQRKCKKLSFASMEKNFEENYQNNVKIQTIISGCKNQTAPSTSSASTTVSNSSSATTSTSTSTSSLSFSSSTSGSSSTSVSTSALAVASTSTSTSTSTPTSTATNVNFVPPVLPASTSVTVPQMNKADPRLAAASYLNDKNLHVSKVDPRMASTSNINPGKKLPIPFPEFYGELPTFTNTSQPSRLKSILKIPPFYSKNKTKRVTFKDKPDIKYIPRIIGAIRKVDWKDARLLSTYTDRAEFNRLNFQVIDITESLITNFLQWSNEWLVNKDANVNAATARIFPLPNKFQSFDDYEGLFFSHMKLEYQSMLEREYISTNNVKPIHASLENVVQKPDRTSLICRIQQRLDRFKYELVVVNFPGRRKCFAHVSGNRKGFECLTIILDTLPDNETLSCALTMKEILIRPVVDNIRVEFGAFNAIHQMKTSPLMLGILNPLTLLENQSLRKRIPQYKGYDPLNSEQKEALLKTYLRAIDENTPNVSLIHGPPGTGKSCVIANLALQCLYGDEVRYLDKKILICAQSNCAIDVISAKLLKISMKMRPESRFRVVRFGVTEKIDPAVKSISLQNIVKNYHLKRLAQNENVPYNNIQNLKEQIRELEATIREIRNKNWKGTVLEDDLQKKTNQLKLLKSSVEQTMRPEDERELYKNFLRGSHIICTTLSSCVKLSQYINYLDICIIDEATQCTEPWTLLPLRFGLSSLVLVGDTQQLPATVLSKKAAEYGLGISLFTRIQNCLDNVYKFNDGVPKPENVVSYKLKVQYRMHPEICKWPNHYFYGNDLVCAEVTTSFQTPLLPFAILSLSYTQNANCSDGKIKNHLEAEFVAKLLSALNQYLPTKTNSYGIITPYANHRDALEKEIKKIQGLSDIMVNTIDSYQGVEKDVIIISNARTNGIGFLGNYQRLNVALTRPKKCLLLCGNFKNLEAVPAWRNLLQNARERKLLFEISANCIHDMENYVIRKIRNTKVSSNALNNKGENPSKQPQSQSMKQPQLPKKPSQTKQIQQPKETHHSLRPSSHPAPQIQFIPPPLPTTPPSPLRLPPPPLPQSRPPPPPVPQLPPSSSFTFKEPQVPGQVSLPTPPSSLTNPDTDLQSIETEIECSPPSPPPQWPLTQDFL